MRGGALALRWRVSSGTFSSGLQATAVLAPDDDAADDDDDDGKWKGEVMADVGDKRPPLVLLVPLLVLLPLARCSCTVSR